MKWQRTCSRWHEGEKMMAEFLGELFFQMAGLKDCLCACWRVWFVTRRLARGFYSGLQGGCSHLKNHSCFFVLQSGIGRSEVSTGRFYTQWDCVAKLYVWASGLRTERWYLCVWQARKNEAERRSEKVKDEFYREHGSIVRMFV